MSSSEPTPENPVAEIKPDINEQPVSKDKEPAKKDTPKPQGTKPTLMLLFIIIVLTASAAAVYYGQDLLNTFNAIKNTDQQQADHLALLSTQLKNAETQIQEYSQGLSQLTAEFNEQKKQLEVLSDSQKNLVYTAKNTYNITHRNQRQWLLAEVSYLLSLANQRLLVSGDIKTAVAALKSANNRLHDLADPGLLTLRKTIADEIAQLNLIKLPDVDGIAFNLDNLSASVTQLPFKSAQEIHSENSLSSEKIELATIPEDSFFAPVWERLKSLVTVKHHNRSVQKTETAVEKNDIDKQLNYRIQTSRVALINSNTKLFNAEISTALELATLYYDQKDNRVSVLISELTPLTQIQLQPELPDITGSWKTLQKIIAVNNANENMDPDSLNKNKGTSEK